MSKVNIFTKPSLILCLVLACSCAEPTYNQSKLSETDVSSFEKQYGSYRLEKPASLFKPQKAITRIKNTWRVSANTSLKLNMRDGKQTSPNHYLSSSTFSIIQNGKEIDTKKVSYYYRGDRLTKSTTVYASENSILVREIPAWTNQQYILFTRQSASHAWSARYIDIPTAPILGEGPEPTILDLTNSHLIINDDGKTYRYPLNKLPTAKADNPFTVG